MIKISKDVAIIVLGVIQEINLFYPSKKLSLAQDAIATALDVPICFGQDDCSSFCLMDCKVATECSVVAEDNFKAQTRPKA